MCEHRNDVASAGCRFCLDNGLLADAPLLSLSKFYLLGSIDPLLPSQVMIVPLRHMDSPFDLSIEEWSEVGEALKQARAILDGFQPNGWTIGWNVGRVAGQEVFHAHLHVIARFDDEPTAGRGIHALFRVHQ